MLNRNSNVFFVFFVLVGCCNARTVSFSFDLSTESVPLSADFVGGGTTILSTCSGTAIATTSVDFARAVSLWKWGAIGSSTHGLQAFVHLECPCDSANWRCFASKQAVVGEVQSIELQPFVSVFSRDVTIGRTFYIDSLKGFVVPGTNGGRHNGCVRADDKRSYIASNELSLFTGFHAFELELLAALPTSALNASYNNDAPCSPIFFDIAIPGGQSACTSPGCSGCLLGGNACQTCLRGYTGAATGCMTCDSGYSHNAAGECVPQCESAGCVECYLPNRCASCKTGFVDPENGCRICESGTFPQCWFDDIVSSSEEHVLPESSSNEEQYHHDEESSNEVISSSEHTVVPGESSSGTMAQESSSEEEWHYHDEESSNEVISSSEHTVVPGESSSDNDFLKSESSSETIACNNNGVCDASESCLTCSSDCPCYQSDCNSANCDGSTCVCSSTTTPGSIARENTPQFIIVTFDDASTLTTWEEVIFPLLNNDSAADAAGCNLRATFFVSNLWSSYHVFTMAHALGCEIASHTWSHETTNLTLTNEWLATISNSRRCLARYVNISSNEITGFRAPKLEWNSYLFDSLKQLGMRYDSSMSSVFELDNAWLWPNTLDFGVPEVTPWPWYVPIGVSTSSWSSLWEVPFASIINATNDTVASMDYDYFEAYPLDDEGFGDILRASFDMHYSTTRSPMFVPLHAWMITPERLMVLQDFLAYAATQPDVYYATMAELVEWTSNPVSSSSIAAAGGMPGCIAFKQKMETRTPLDEKEICDGLDNDGDGLVDEGVTNDCPFPDTPLGWMSFNSCTPCPKVYVPNDDCNE